jgi:hypothetical protein
VAETAQDFVARRERHPDAGKWGSFCYRTACQQPNAVYFNTSTREHYCLDCATRINMGCAMHNEPMICSKAEQPE